MADSITDIATRQQVALERIKSGFDRDFAGVAVSLRAKVREVFSRLDVDTLDELSLVDLSRLLVRLEAEQMKITGAYVADFEKELQEVAKFSASLEVAQLGSLDTGALAPLILKRPKPSKIYREALRRPLHATGDLLEPFIRDLPEMEAARINKAVRTGHSQGLTTPQMVRQLVGTKKNNWADGSLDKIRRDIKTMTHTAIQHVNAVARDEVWKTDPRTNRPQYWLSVLDSRTSLTCKGLSEMHGVGSGNPLPFGKGPQPPVHPNCRSLRVPALSKKYSFLQEGRTQSASGDKKGYVPGDLTYYEWLETQSAEFQDFALGPTRGKLFRDGGLNSDEFAALSLDKNFQPMTLDEMKAEAPKSFALAGV